MLDFYITAVRLGYLDISVVPVLYLDKVKEALGMDADTTSQE